MTKIKKIEPGKKYKYFFVKQSYVKKQSRSWLHLCECICGNTFFATTGDLNRSRESCGCIHVKNLRQRSTKHLQTKTPTFKAWYSMIRRCRGDHPEKNKYYKDRNIYVCERWKTYLNFLEDMGEKPSCKHSLDRVNNDGVYEPNNCRWATAKEQANNRRKPLRKNNQRSECVLKSPN